MLFPFGKQLRLVITARRTNRTKMQKINKSFTTVFINAPFHKSWIIFYAGLHILLLASTLLSFLSSCSHSEGSLSALLMEMQESAEASRKNCWNLVLGITPIEEIPIFLWPTRVQRKVVYFGSDGEGSWNKSILLRERRSHSDTDKRWKWNNFLSSGKPGSSWQNNSSRVDGEGLEPQALKGRKLLCRLPALLKVNRHTPRNKCMILCKRLLSVAGFYSTLKDCFIKCYLVDLSSSIYVPIN